MNRDKRVMSEDERQARKLFQNFFTKLLYSKDSKVQNVNLSKMANALCEKACTKLWKSFIERFYYDHDIWGNERTLNECVETGWEHIARIYLKGGKSTLSVIKSILENLKDVTSKNITRAFFMEIRRNTDDSDFDFCFLLNPLRFSRDLIQESKYILEAIVNHMIEDMREELEKEMMILLLSLCNDSYYQCRLIYDDIKKGKLIQYFTQPEQKILTEFMKDSERRIQQSSYSEPAFFQFTVDFPLVAGTNKSVMLDNNSFFLMRIFIPLHFINNEYDSVFRSSTSTISGKLFAECIDISISLTQEENEALWKKTSSDDILRPLKYLDTNHSFNDEEETKESTTQFFHYPIVDLSYQMNDLLNIVSEATPNKPEKRCRRLIEQLYFSCINEKLPSLPETIRIGETIHKLMNENTKNDCSDLHKLIRFTGEVEYTNSGQSVYVYETIEAIRNLDVFEKWCKERSFSLAWESSCSTITKMELQNRIQYILGISPGNDWSKQFVCSLYKDLILITTLANLWVAHRERNLEIQNEMLNAFQTNWGFNGRQLSLEELMEFLTNRMDIMEDHYSRYILSKVQHYFRIYTMTKFETVSHMRSAKDFILSKLRYKCEAYRENRREEAEILCQSINDFIALCNRFTLL